MAKAESLVHGRAGFLGELPGFFAIPRVAGGVEAKDRGEDAKLDPAGCEFVVAVAVEVAA